MGLRSDFPLFGVSALTIRLPAILLAALTLLIFYRAMGLSMVAQAEPTYVLSDPVLSVYNSSRTLIATNDNWQADPNQFEIQANGLCPPIYRNRPLHCDSQGKEPTPGIGLVELYDLSPLSTRLVNMNTRGSVGATDDVLISGFIVGDVNNATVILRPWPIARFFRSRIAGPAISQEIICKVRHCRRLTKSVLPIV